MPYVIRKKTKLFHTRPIGLEVRLDDDKLPKHYFLDSGSGVKTLLRGKVTLLTDKNNYVKCVVNKDYDFHVFSIGTYRVGGTVAYTRRLILPNDLVKDYALDEGMGIELLLHEISTGGKVEKIYSESREEGSMEFEPLGMKGEISADSELLINTRFVDEFYNELALEINSAYRLRLFTATMVLVRKLFENLIIDLLRHKYGERLPQIDLYYSTKNQRFHSFSTLIHNLETNVDDFKIYNVGFQWDRSRGDFFKFLRDVK
jgi:hypothetical protein